MEEYPHEPEDERHRFLLPDGCKDLIDVILLQKSQENLKSWKAGKLKPAKPSKPVPVTPETPDPAGAGLPASAILPESMTVTELATLLQIKISRVIRQLMEMDLYYTPATPITFSTAAAVCGQFGVIAIKAV